MAKLYITEYADTSASGGTSLGIPEEPATAVQVVDFTAGVTASAAFKPNTSFVEIHTDAICSVKFGTAPVAATTDTRMAANQTRTVAVPSGGGVVFKVSAIVNT